MDSILYKHKKKIIIGVIAVFLVIIGISVYNLIWNSIYCATVEILVAPYIAKVNIDGQEYGVNGSHKVKPGEHNVYISADGFEAKNLSIVAVKDEIVNLFEYLEPKEENANWYEEHQGDALVVAEIVYAKNNEAMRKLAEKNPILNSLPVAVEYYTPNYAKYINYNLRYELGEDEKIVIWIDDLSGGNKDVAMERLKSFGDDLSKYEIKYNDKSASYRGD